MRAVGRLRSSFMGAPEPRDRSEEIAMPANPATGLAPGREAKRRTEALRGGSQVRRNHLDVTVGGLKGRPCLLA